MISGHQRTVPVSEDSETAAREHATNHGTGRDLREDRDDRQPPVLVSIQWRGLQQGSLQ